MAIKFGRPLQRKIGFMPLEAEEAGEVHAPLDLPTRLRRNRRSGHGCGQRRDFVRHECRSGGLWRSGILGMHLIRHQARHGTRRRRTSNAACRGDDTTRRRAG